MPALDRKMLIALETLANGEWTTAEQAATRTALYNGPKGIASVFRALALQRLVETQLPEVRKRSTPALYRITPKGQALLEAQKQAAQRFASTG